MSVKKYYLRIEVANYLRISRMTLSRWEKVLPLPVDYMGCRLKPLTSKEINAWHEKLRNKYSMKQDHIQWRRARVAVS